MKFSVILEAVKTTYWSAYNKGVDAFKKGDKKEDCPSKKGLGKEGWMDGWEAQSKEKEDK